ncbi:hypothetical protein BVF91_11150 [Thermoanaerobacterium sp. PSU-2]|uniref:S-layer homology domain-containing protein n=1 Tax=Thermoanaerobacterium sp. PSU-2 TaxID=1930849 RepID=UPI000A14CFC3|nr:S-layer homology domain-containing protein [Thermoanaerobacterium sp. PSU-2]ORX22557.1 hypothetical protein BVF91_11150 [Thermoanaerobacterium sp. PSU-2]
MKNLKKLIAVVLTFTLVFSAMAVGFAGTFSDVSSSAPYASAVARLQQLGLVSGMPDGTFQPDGAVTRAQMIAFVNAAEGLQNAAKVAVGPTKFKDVPASYWASGDINIADPSGYPDGTFRPDNTVTYPEALAMLLRALGITGDLSWPYGVIAKAADVGLTNGVNLSANATINRGQMAILVNNALDLPLYTYDTNGNLVKETDKSGNEIDLISKIATPTEYVVLATANQSNAGTGNVKLYDVTNKKVVIKSAGNIDFSQYVGEDVNVYFTSDGTPVYVSENTNPVKEYDNAKIVSGEVYDNSTTTPTDTGLSLANTDYILYNNYLTNWSHLNGKVPTYGSVKFISNKDDSNGNPVYNYAVVTAYEYPDANGEYGKLVTSNVASGATYIATDSGNYTLVDSNGNAYPVTVAGDVSSLTDIKANDVLYYGKQYDDSGNQVGLYLYVVRKTVTGKVTETAGTSSIKIDGTSYDLTDSYNASSNIASVGDSGTFVLDKDGKIFRFLGTSTVSTNFAIALNNSNTSSKLTSKIELLTSDGSDTVYTWDPTNVYGAVYNDKLVEFTFNSDKTVVSNVYGTNTGTISDANSVSINNFASNQSASFDTTTNTLKFNSGILNNNSQYGYLSASTAIFVVDASGNYSVAKLSDLTSGSYQVQAIAYDTVNNVKAVLLYNPTFVSSNTSTVNAYITNVVPVTTSSSTFDRITAYVNGVQTTYDTTGTTGTSGTAYAKGAAYTLTIDNNTGKVVDAKAATTNGMTSVTVYNSDINTVNMTIKVGTQSFALAPGYQFIAVDNLASPTTYSLGYASDIASTGTLVNLYFDATGRVVAIVYAK